MKQTSPKTGWGGPSSGDTCCSALAIRVLGDKYVGKHAGGSFEFIYTATLMFIVLA